MNAIAITMLGSGDNRCATSAHVRRSSRAFVGPAGGIADDSASVQRVPSQ